MFHHILIPTDLSDHTVRAADMARDMGRTADTAKNSSIGAERKWRRGRLHCLAKRRTITANRGCWIKWSRSCATAGH